jgi:putative holliday junction resolvase
MRYLGIDFGEKRIGLSFGDELGVATPLSALTGLAPSAALERLVALIRDRRVTELVLGHPLNMDGTAGPKAREVEAFAARLTAAAGLPVHLIDERLTTYEAESSIPRRKRRAVRASGLVDSRAACLILQDFLDQRIAPPSAEPRA